jgi:hypothetical protein
MRLLPLILAASLPALLAHCGSSKKAPTKKGRVLSGVTEYYRPGSAINSSADIALPPGVPTKPPRRSFFFSRNRSDDSGNRNPYEVIPTIERSSGSSGGTDLSSHTHGTTFANPDGTTSRIVGSAMVRSDGTKAWIIGNTVFHSDGARSRIVGDKLINADGTVSRTLGGAQ